MYGKFLYTDDDGEEVEVDNSESHVLFISAATKGKSHTVVTAFDYKAVENLRAQCATWLEWHTQSSPRTTITRKDAD